MTACCAKKQLRPDDNVDVISKDRVTKDSLHLDALSKGEEALSQYSVRTCVACPASQVKFYCSSRETAELVYIQYWLNCAT